MSLEPHQCSLSPHLGVLEFCLANTALKQDLHLIYTHREELMAGVALTPNPASMADITNQSIVLPEPKLAYRQTATADQLQLVHKMKPVGL